MIDEKIKILTAKGGIQQISPQLHDYICLSSERKLYYNAAYPNHPQVLNKIAYFKQAKLFDGSPIPLTSAEIRAFYDENIKNIQESSQFQCDISDLFKLAANEDASDVHINVRKNECVIRVRKIGDLDIDYEYTAAHGHKLCKTIFMTMCDQAGKTFQPKSRQDARMKSAFLPDGITGVRIGTSPTDAGYIMVCRLLKKSDPGRLNLATLGYELFQIDQINQAKSKKGGINFFAGPTGSGKSTTMSIIVSKIIEESNGTKHVITAENPVEYEIGGEIVMHKEINGQIVTKKVMAYATQTPIMAANTKRKKEIFGEAIVAMMRLDPDVIMIGEIRDAGSLKAAIDASMTGHQVWTSVHATSAIGIIKRLITVSGDNNGDLAKDLICDSNIVSSLMAQRLVKKVCPHCSLSLESHLPTLESKLIGRLIEALGKDLSGIRVKNESGCNRCHRGNVGRTVVAEIINTDQKFMALIAQSNFEAETYWLDALHGMPMMAHGLLKVKRGLIDPYDLEDELEFIQLPKAFDKDYLYKLLGNN
ncbi:MAG: Flp pilus assembly complex ATPase component TadA [Burkholderiales bacterium]|nr:Flp pilus assembly complex ATPase component TadA [Burkholderiales bacterium]